MGYSKNLVVASPAVMDLNMRAASMAMLWIRHLLQPFLAEPMPHSLRESVTNFTTKAIEFQQREGCPVCGVPERLGSGGVFRLTTKSAMHLMR